MEKIPVFVNWSHLHHMVDDRSGSYVLEATKTEPGFPQWGDYRHICGIWLRLVNLAGSPVLLALVELPLRALNDRGTCRIYHWSVG